MYINVVLMNHGNINLLCVVLQVSSPSLKVGSYSLNFRRTYEQMFFLFLLSLACSFLSSVNILLLTASMAFNAFFGNLNDGELSEFECILGSHDITNLCFPLDKRI